MIRVEDVTKSYPLRGLRRHYVFRGLNLELPKRVNIGIVGRNGAGKSTLLRLLGGVDLPDSGRIMANGSISPPVGSASGFAPALSGRDNAKFICRVAGDGDGTLRERVRYIQEFAELGKFFDLPVKFYSTGMRARLAFAISMVYDYDYYLIDELTAAGDLKFREKATQTFEEKKGKASIIMVSHSLGMLRKECQVGLYVKAGGFVFYFDDINDAVAAYERDQK